MAKQLVWQQLVGQERVAQTLASAFSSNTLGHAYLFSGDAGVGKFQAALEICMALHCEHASQVPCFNCSSCTQILNYSHPDFHVVFPVTLDASHKSSGDSTKLSEAGWNYIAEETRYKLANPYSIEETRLKHIPVEWIRELNHSIMRGSVKGGVNTAIFCDVDTMQKESANAMLKTLEEPPARTMIILLTSRPHSVLPTIRSRCQIIRFGNIASQEMRQALIKVHAEGRDETSLDHVVERANGSMGKALLLLEESLDEFSEKAAALWEACASKMPWQRVNAELEALSQELLGGGWDYAAGEKLMLSFQFIVRKTYFQTIQGAQNYLSNESALSPEVPPLDIYKAEKLYASCENSVSAVRSRVNAHLVLLCLIMEIMEILHGKEYQAS